MKKKAILFAGILLASLFQGTLHNTGCLAENITPIDFEREISENNLQLTLYYIKMDKLTRAPLSVEDVKARYDYKVVVNAQDLRRCLSSLRKLNQVQTVELPDSPGLGFLRIYGEFTSAKGTLMSFGLQSVPGGMLLNGKVVQSQRLFYEILIPFLPRGEGESYKETVRGIFG